MATYYPADGNPVTLSFAGSKPVEVTAKGYTPAEAAALSVCDSYASLGVLTTSKPKKESD